MFSKLVFRSISTFGKAGSTPSTFSSGRASPYIVTSGAFTRAMSSEKPTYQYETLEVKTEAPFVSHVIINRPEKLNAMNKSFWREMRECFHALNDDADCRAVVISGAGRAFTSGLDLQDMGDFFTTIQSEEDLARKAKTFYNFIRSYQDSFTAVEKCQKPVIAAVHSACIGGGVDLISSADIRYCTEDAIFQIKEVELGLAADVGTVQRLPKIVGNDSIVRELAYSARKFPADEAKSIGFVGRVFKDKASMMEAALSLASQIASISPVAVQGTKINLNYSRDHTVDESLEYMARWNSIMLQSEDLTKAVMALMAKQKATFSKL